MISLTKSTKPIKEKDIKREWHVIDVSKKPLGRVVTAIATIIAGKHKTNYVSNLDLGDYVVVVNASKIQISGKKKNTKTYSSYSGYPGGLKIRTFSYLSTHKPEEIVRHAVSGMLPKNKLREKRLSRLFVFRDENHPYGKKTGK